MTAGHKLNKGRQLGIAERRLRDFQHREAVILDAALKLFDSDSWLSVTVDQIAEKAEIGKGTVYKHFSSKEDIYARLTINFYYGLLNELERLDQCRKVILILRELLITALRYHYKCPEYRRVTQYCKRADFKDRTSPELRQAFDELDSRFLQFIEALFVRGIREKEIPETSIMHLRYGMRACFDGSMDTIWTGYIGQQRVNVEEYMEVMADFMIAGIAGLGKFSRHGSPAGRPVSI